MNVVGYQYNNKAIAIVDDEEDIVTLFTVLQENGYHVIGFINPLFILDYISEHPDRFSLIIVDYRMSPMQRGELVNEIAAINPKIKMILLTAYNDIKK